LLLSMLSMTDGIPTVAELMDSPLAKYIILAQMIADIVVGRRN
jgi:hypothetical protein